MKIPVEEHRRSRGATLMEVLVASAILVVGVAGVMVITGNLSKLSVSMKLRQRITAELLARMSSVSSLPYSSIRATSASYFSTDFLQCTCQPDQAHVSNYDQVGSYPASFPPQDVLISGRMYEIRTCINYVKVSGSTSQDVCPNNAIPDPGAKNVVIYAVDLSQKSGSQSLYVAGIKNLVTRTAGSSMVNAGATLKVPLCKAEPPPNPTVCDDPNIDQIQNATVSMEKSGVHYMGSVPGVALTPPTYTVSIDLLAGDNYTMFINLPNYFPVVRTGQSIRDGQTVTLPVIPLLKISEYAATAKGETYTARHPLIAGVICATSRTSGACSGDPGCTNNRSQGIWLLNPLTVDVPVDLVNNLKFYYANSPLPQSLTLTQGAQTQTIKAGGYLFGLGRDTAAMPTGLPAWASWAPDFEWDAAANNMIPCNVDPILDTNAAGIILSLPGSPSDILGWNDVNNSPPPAAVRNNNPLPAGTLQPMICQ